MRSRSTSQLVPSLLALLTLTLTACGTTTPRATLPAGTVSPPPPSAASPAQLTVWAWWKSSSAAAGPAPCGPRWCRAWAPRRSPTATCATLGTATTQSIIDFAGKHYLQATFPLTNNCGRDLNNLTYVATRRIDATPTIGDSAVTLMTTATGSAADPSLAPQILPTQPVYASGSKLAGGSKPRQLAGL